MTNIRPLVFYMYYKSFRITDTTKYRLSYWNDTINYFNKKYSIAMYSSDGIILIYGEWR